MSSEQANAMPPKSLANSPEDGEKRVPGNLFGELSRAGVRIDRKLDRLFAPVSGITPELESLLARLREKQ